MIIHAPTIILKNGQVHIASHFEMQTPIPNLPEELWYRFPEHYAGQLSLRADAFAPTALLVAMYAGEDLTVRGPISPRLAYNLYEYRNIYHSWNPKLFKHVHIRYEHLEPPPQPIGKTGVVTAFSGGVDSFYTLWAHLPQNQPVPDAQITHGLFVHGLDLRLDDEANYQIAAETYSQVFDELGLELIQASTNAYQFSEFRINWTMFFGAPTIGAALLLTPWLCRFYVPSGFPSYLKLIPFGCHPLSDHLLSTETAEIVHYGASVNRYDKLATLIEWPATYHKLRVCSDKGGIKGLDNCSSCHKCYRTMALLKLLDALQRYNNFSEGIAPGDYLRWGFLTPLNLRYAVFIRDKSFKNGQLGMAFWMQIAIILRVISKFMLESFKKLLSDEQLYRLKRMIYKPETDIMMTKQ